MSTLTTFAAKSAVLETITVDQLEAERLTGLSSKTLDRHAARGESVGRVKIGRRVLYVRDVLESWIKSKLSAN